MVLLNFLYCLCLCKHLAAVERTLDNKKEQKCSGGIFLQVLCLVDFFVCIVFAKKLKVFLDNPCLQSKAMMVI